MARRRRGVDEGGMLAGQLLEACSVAVSALRLVSGFLLSVERPIPHVYLIARFLFAL